MGRKRLRDRHLPERVYYQHGAYYLVLDSKWLRLGSTLSEMYQALAKMEVQNENILRMEQLLDRYLREVVSLKKPATQRSNLNSIQFLRPFFGQMKVSEVETIHAYQYREVRKASGSSAVNRDLEVLSHLFSKAIEWGLIGNDKHPIRGLQIKLPTPARDRYVTDDEVARFMEICGDFLRCYLGIKLMTGLAKSDILSITMQSIQSDGIHYTRRKTEGRGAKPKIISMTPELAEAIATARKIRPSGISSIYLFATKDGQPYIKEDGKTSGFDSIWQRKMAKAVALGIERFTEHDLRAKVASDTTLDHAQKLMGHTSPGITERVYRRAPEVVFPLSNKNK